MGHNASVMSVDFHPNKDDLICSCDGDGEIRYWSINNGSYASVFKVEFRVQHIEGAVVEWVRTGGSHIYYQFGNF